MGSEMCIRDRPWGHIGEVGKQVAMFHDNPPSMGPAGTVHCSLRDWAKFIQLHLGVEPTTGKASSKPLLKRKTLASLHTPNEGEDYALGWMVLKRAWSKGPVLHHNGSNTMWLCVAWLAPKEKFAVLVTCNHGGGAAACDDLAAACIAEYRK